MISIDTNILVRYLQQDDLHQAKVADRIIGEAVAQGEAIFVADVVVCELVWVLETCYSCSKGELVPVFDKLLRAAQFVFQDKGILWAALEEYRDGKGDYSDYLIGHTAKAGNASTTYTFDKALRNCPLFTVV